MLTDRDIGYFNSAFRVDAAAAPAHPIETRCAPVSPDGTPSTLVSDHMPVTADEKTLPFVEATPGAAGPELLLGLAAALARTRPLTLAQSLAGRHRRAGACARAGPRLAGRKRWSPGGGRRG